MQRNMVILLRTSNATGRNILTGILKRIKNRDRCTIRIAGDAEDFRRLAASATMPIADASAPADTILKAVADGMPVVMLNDWRFKEQPANLGHIRTDDGDIGFKAADYFLSIGRFRSFGYVPAYTDKEWSVKRGRAFAHRLSRRGQTCVAFDPAEDGEDVGASTTRRPYSSAASA